MATKKKMNKYAVAYVSLFDNDLKVEVIEATNEKEAFLKHSCISGDDGMSTFIDGLDTIESIKEECFNCDCLLDVKEIQ